MPAPDVVRELVKRFEENIDSYRSGKYNETQLRREFLDPLFEALGWDVFNKAGYAEAYKDVIHEDSIEVEGATKAPDYAFRIGGQRKFFLEAKKPSVKVETDIYPAFQLRRYSWSAKLPIGVLSDFEELAVYETRSKPNKKDKASTGRIAFYKYTDYIEKWDEIAGIFSREAVLKGSFDTFAEGQKKKKGTAEVDDAFLEEIERWRELLAKNFALRNPDLTVRELNYAVQVTIDRIVFLRICEDRGIEPYEKLKLASQQSDIYSELIKIFQQADERYNSGLFHFPTGRKAKDEKNASSAADSLTLSLNVDDKVLKEILGGLYYPESPYVFSEIPSDILGQVYERFLGKVIRLTAGHQAKVEEKPEVRKAGGVYYTPTYIVEYIVKNTVGKMLDGKSPDDVEKLRILDPACGSGTFAIGAYAYLLDWHRDWYSANDPQKWAKRKNPPIFQARDGWQLTLEKKKEILLNNIYGVDIDPQAVEVTKLSLLLKLVENPGQLDFMSGRILPDLSQNIKCGNSLIGPDYYNEKQFTMGFDDEDERYRVNAFDWKTEFASIFNRGGFDAVIGNPPYVRQEMLGELKDYFRNTYKSFNGVADLYVYFIERGVSILKSNGIFCYIVSNKWLRANYGKSIRGWLKDQHIKEIVDFGDLPVFESATTYPCILSISKGEPNVAFRVTQVDSLKFRNLNEYVNQNYYELDQTRLDDSGWSLVNNEVQNLLDKLNQVAVPLKQYTNGKMYRGIVTGNNQAFVIDLETKKRLITEDPKSAEIIKPFLAGRDIKRYDKPVTEKYLIFTRRGINIKEYSAIEKYLSQFKERLTPKPKNWKGDKWVGRKSGNYKWYEIQDAIDYYEDFETNKILWPEIAGGARFTYDESRAFANNKVFLIPDGSLYLLGLLNSSLLKLFIHSVCTDLQGNSYNFSSVFLENTPIRTIDFSNAEDKARHDKLVSLVERMLELTPLLSPQFQQTELGGRQAPRTPQEKERVRREIEATDTAIDRLVYELYGLTEEEIKIVEGRE